MRVAICDDDKKCIQEIEACLQEFGKQYTVTYDIFHSGEEILAEYEREKYKYDVIVMDIELERINGVETANLIRNVDKTVTIFFLTSHTKYAIECFKCAPKNFWVKPIKYDVFCGDMVEVYKDVNRGKGYFSFEDGKQLVKLEYKKILYFESDNKKVKIYTFDKVYEVNRALKKYASILEQEHFFSPHKSFYVNLRYVETLHSDNLVLAGDITIPVSKSRRKIFRNTFINFVNRRIEE